MIKKTLEKENLKVAESYLVKPEKSGGCCGEVPKATKEYFPSISLDSRVLPEIKDWELDEEYTVVLKITMKSKSMNTRGEKKEEVYDGYFDIKEAGVVETTKEEKKEEGDNKVKAEIKKMYE